MGDVCPLLSARPPCHYIFFTYTHNTYVHLKKSVKNLDIFLYFFEGDFFLDISFIFTT